MRTLVLTTALLVSLVAFACSAAANDSPPRGAADFPPSCRIHAEAVFWTASDWVPLSEALAADLSPCADYYVSIPPQAADKTALRGLQDELIRALGPRIHPVAEMTLGTLTGWNHWVNAVPGRTWFGAGVEFRRRMAVAGYRFDLGETWLLNEFDRSTRRDEPLYTRAAMRDLLRGLYDGGGTQPPPRASSRSGSPTRTRTSPTSLSTRRRWRVGSRTARSGTTSHPGSGS